MLVVVRALTPSAAVQRAFGVNGSADALAGGQGTAYRVEDVVLKVVDDADETAWTSELLTRVRPDGFRVCAPVATGDGRWVHDGWAASRFIPGLQPMAPRWRDVIEAGLRFCEAAEHARRDDDAALANRTHRWAIADRVTWGEQPARLAGDAAELFREISAGFEPSTGSVQFIHGDLTGNVFIDEDGTPVILDVSPYLRPHGWAAAIVVCDALLWHDADLDLVDAIPADGRRDLLLRALAFRFLADEFARISTGRQPEYGRYRAVVRSLQ